MAQQVAQSSVHNRSHVARLSYVQRKLSYWDLRAGAHGVDGRARGQTCDLQGREERTLRVEAKLKNLRDHRQQEPSKLRSRVCLHEQLRLANACEARSERCPTTAGRSMPVPR